MQMFVSYKNNQMCLLVEVNVCFLIYIKLYVEDFWMKYCVNRVVKKIVV